MSEIETPKQHTGLSENSPTVTFDINLGKYYDSVDFDYKEFDREADKLGMSTDTRSGLSITFDSNINILTGGRFHGDGDRIEIKTFKKSNKHINKYLIHEMQHAVDVQAGFVPDYRYKVGRFAVNSFIGLTVAGFILGPVDLAVRNNIFERGPYQAATLAAGAVMYWGYNRHPIERRAQKAAKDSQKKVVLTVKS
jgi:hypothetical protein